MGSEVTCHWFFLNPFFFVGALLFKNQENSMSKPTNRFSYPSSMTTSTFCFRESGTTSEFLLSALESIGSKFLTPTRDKYLDSFAEFMNLQYIPLLGISNSYLSKEELQDKEIGEGSGSFGLSLSEAWIGVSQSSKLDSTVELDEMSLGQVEFCNHFWNAVNPAFAYVDRTRMIEIPYDRYLKADFSHLPWYFRISNSIAMKCDTAFLLNAPIASCQINRDLSISMQMTNSYSDWLSSPNSTILDYFRLTWPNIQLLAAKKPSRK